MDNPIQNRSTAAEDLVSRPTALKPHQALTTSSQRQIAQTSKPLPALQDDPEGRVQVREVITQCWRLMRLFGRKAEDLPTVLQAFERFLRNWPTGKIVAAFERYAESRDEFPTVNQILGILEGRVKRDPAYYRELVRQRIEGGHYALTSVEHSYIASYEEQARNDFE